MEGLYIFYKLFVNHVCRGEFGLILHFHGRVAMLTGDGPNGTLAKTFNIRDLIITKCCGTVLKRVSVYFGAMRLFHSGQNYVFIL